MTAPTEWLIADNIAGLIEAIDPLAEPDLRFFCPYKADDGPVEDIEDLVGKTRVFEVLLDVSGDAGVAGRATRIDADLVVTVRYDSGRAKQRRWLLEAHDAGLIMAALAEPTGWHLSVCTVEPLQDRPGRIEVSDEERLLCDLIEYRFRLQYDRGA